MDPLAARQFKDLIGQLSRRGKTVILSSHLLADMEDVCDRVGILYAGQLRAEGTLDDLLAQRNLTQFVTEHLDEATAEKVRQTLAQANKRLLAVEAPKDRLESLFLRIVREAMARRERTPGAVETGQVAEFLRATSAPVGREVIEGLLAKPQEAAATEAPAPEPAPPPPAGEVLEELLSGPREASPQPPSEPAAAPEPAQPAPAGKDADRGVIDSLVRKDREKPPDA
jgi:ABC-2 type transport system ATP-binding protein